MTLIVSPETIEKRATFFRYIFGSNKGLVCLAALDREAKKLTEEFFEYPEQLGEMLTFVDKHTMTRDVFFCPQMLSLPKRIKENVDKCTCAWADLDECTLDKLLVEPTIGIESSPNRFQALWVFTEAIDPAEAEDISRRIAYYHKDDGADRSGWDLTQLLRVPFTYNHKYFDPSVGEMPVVKVVRAHPGHILTQVFAEKYPQVEGFLTADIPFPEEIPDPDEVLQEHRNHLMPTVWHLYEKEPEEEADWSRLLWQLQMLLFEGGCTREEVFAVAKDSGCNKYRRDGRSDLYLWREVCRAYGSYTERHNIVSSRDIADAPLLTDQERHDAEGIRTIVDEYIDWAKGMGDAAWQYHQAGAFVVLSSILAGPVRLPTSYGTIVPNLWFMILADTTLTRKTTAMDLAIDIMQEVDPEAILATDGSIEGLFTSLSMRQGKPSIFLRDEFSGLLESITKKDYYAGMAETLTKLYDGKFQKRVLRKETIEVRDPVLILFAGGIRSRVLQLLNYEHVASGFLPRFIFITAESDVTRLRPLGPPTEQGVGERSRILSRLQHLHSHYTRPASVEVAGRHIEAPRTWEASLTEDAWARFAKFEADLLKMGLESQHSDILTPTYDRLAKSGLKVAVLLAATRRLEEKVVVEESDLIKAFSYVEAWRGYGIDVINNIGKTTQEKDIDQVLQAIIRKPGILRSELMRNFHLTSVKASAILATLDERMLITRAKHGRTERLYPTGVLV